MGESLSSPSIGSGAVCSKIHGLLLKTGKLFWAAPPPGVLLPSGFVFGGHALYQWGLCTRHLQPPVPLCSWGGGSDISGRSQEGSEGTRRSLQKPGASELGWQHQESWLAVELGAAFGIPCIPAKSMERGTVAAGDWGADDCPSVGEGRDSCWPKSPTGPGGVYCLGAWAGAPRIHCPEAGLGPHPEHFGSVSTQKGILEKRVRNPPACSLGDDPGGVNS